MTVVMEKWCMEMGFEPDDIDDFCKNFKKLCPPHERTLWRHLLKHVQPREVADMVRKQCLLARLRTSRRSEKIEVHLTSIKDYNNYLKMKADQKNYEALQEKINKKKSIIKEHLTKLELSRQMSLSKEEELKEKVNKLSLLKKKSITVTRLMSRLDYESKLLAVITEEPHRVLSFGPETANWQDEVLLLINQLPCGSELQNVHTKFLELLRESKLDPVPHWERTELLTFMEKSILALEKKLVSCKSSLTEAQIKAKEKYEFVLSFMCKESDGRLTEDEVSTALQECRQEIFQDSKKFAMAIINTEEPYALVSERQLIRRLQHEIDEKKKNICSLISINCEEIRHVPFTHEVINLPVALPVEKLKNSLSNEITAFMKMSLYKPSTSETYQNIRINSSNKNLCLQIKGDMKKYLQLVSYVDKISNLRIPSSDHLNSADLIEKINKSYSAMKQSVTKSMELLSKDTKIYSRVKAAFEFWRKEPLNERLTGIEISGHDISFWLKSYSEFKEKLDHEEWLQRERRHEKYRETKKNKSILPLMDISSKQH